MNQSFTDEQMQHLVNIILSCERWTELESIKDKLSKVDNMDSEAEKINNLAIKINNFMFDELVALTGRDRLDPYIDDFYGHSQEFNRICLLDE